MTCTCAGKVLAVPAPCPVHWPDGVVKLMEEAAAKANAKGAGMLTGEQFEKVKDVILSVETIATSATSIAALNAFVIDVLDAIKSQLVLKVEVSPTATATGTIEGLDGLGRRVGQG